MLVAWIAPADAGVPAARATASRPQAAERAVSCGHGRTERTIEKRGYA